MRSLKLPYTVQFTSLVEWPEYTLDEQEIFYKVACIILTLINNNKIMTFLLWSEKRVSIL